MKKKVDPNEEVYLTHTEVKKIERALKDPEFHKYWNEYLDEITDPAGRKEREEYILDQEKHNDLPPNTHLVRPESLMCVKTYTRRLFSTQGPRKYIDQKLFINICTSKFMEPPIKTDVIHEGQKMQNWSLPYTLSKPRATKDNKGDIAMSVDIIFNTKCRTSAQFPEFRKMLCDTALDAVNRYLKEYTEKASQNYKLLSKMKYKGGTPEFILMKKRPTEGQSALSENLKSENHLPKEIKDLYNQQNKQKDQKDDDEAEAPDVDVTAEEAIKQQKKSKKKMRIKAHNEAPKYTITESSVTDMTECFDGPTSDLLPKVVKKLPKSLVIRIELPGVRTTKNAKLEIQEKRLKFQYLENYILDVPLPYYVDDGTAKAKYDKDKQILTLEVGLNKEKNTVKEPSKPEVIDLTDLKRKEVAKEEPIETETIEIPSLFNIYKPSTITKKPEDDKKEKNDKDKIEVKYKEESVEEQEIPVQLKEIESNSKPLITEVKKVERKQEVHKEEKIDYKTAPIIEGKYDFKQLGDFVILTYKIKGYDKETAIHKLTKNEMLLQVFDPSLKANQRTCVTLFAPIILNASNVEFLVDFICVKLKKADTSKIWESLGYQISQLTEIQEKPKEELSQTNEKKEADETEKEKEKEEASNKENERDEEEDEMTEKIARSVVQYIHLKSNMVFDIY